MEKCEKCGGRLKPSLINYEKVILGDTIVIPKVEGYICSECGNTQIDKSIENRLQVKILEEKLKLKRKMKENSQAILVNKIKFIRNERDIPQKKIGEALRISEQRYGAIERNDNTPTIYTIKQLADTLGVPETELYDLVYIPIDIYNQLRNMNDNFQVIEGLPEAREEFESYDFLYELEKEKLSVIEKELKKLNKANVGETKIKNEKRIEDLLGLRKPLKEKIDDMREIRAEKKEKVDVLEKESILKQKYIIDYYTYQKVKRLFDNNLEIKK